jgi:hypothetical protein
MGSWRKSSYTQGANNCVEVWRKSSHSQGADNCVELVWSLDRVRDSKNPGPVLAVDLGRLLAAIKDGRLEG